MRTRAHVVNVSLGVLVAVFKGALLLGLAPEDFVVAVGVEGRVYVNQIHAGIGQLGELFQIVAAIHDAGVEEAEGLAGRAGDDFSKAGLVETFFAMRGD